MKGYELKKELRGVKSGGYCFIKWWRKENDFADYELIDHFLEHLAPEHEFEGFQLLTMDKMWQELHMLDPDRIWMDTHRGEKLLHWKHLGSDGTLREDVYRYSPRVLMALYDRETQGDTLC